MGLRSLALITFVATVWGKRLRLFLRDPGKELVEAVCTTCHTLERVVAKRATKAEWQDKVLEMLQEEADITQQERVRIVEYLAKAFPPKTAEK